jgi:hypothetical protein
MELKDFLLLLFDKNIDRYPTIRESLLVNFNTYEVTNILAITNYHCKKKERIKYTKHDFKDVGVRMISTVYNPTNWSKDNLINITVMSDIPSYVKYYAHKWIGMGLAHGRGTDTEYILNMDTSNTGFIILLSAICRCERIGYIGTDITFDISLTLKVKGLGCPNYCASQSIILASDTDIMSGLERTLDIFCKILTMDSQEIYTWCNVELPKNKLEYKNNRVKKYYISNW